MYYSISHALPWQTSWASGKCVIASLIYLLDGFFPSCAPSTVSVTLKYGLSCPISKGLEAKSSSNSPQGHVVKFYAHASLMFWQFSTHLLNLSHPLNFNFRLSCISQKCMSCNCSPFYALRKEMHL